MKIDHFVVYTVELPMRLSISHTLAERKVASNILVRAFGDNGMEGWGECCPRPYVTGETIETAAADLSGRLLPAMIGESFLDLPEAAEKMASSLPNVKRNQQAAFCAAELAVLDLAGKTFGLSTGEIIGPIERRRVRYSAVIAAKDCTEVRKRAALIRMFGFRDVKIKVQRSLDQNLRILETARKVLGGTVSLRIDANGAWSTDEAFRQIDQLSPFGLAAVEQPVGADNIEGMQQITGAKMLPVVADESLCSLQDAEMLIQRRAADVFNLRVSKCGGLINTLRIYRKAVRAGLSCQVGAQVGETAILSAAGRHLATRCPSIIWREGSYGVMLLRHDIAYPGMTIGIGGRARALESPGLGIEPDLSRIAEYVRQTTEVHSCVPV